MRDLKLQQADVLVKQVLSSHYAAAIEILFQEPRNKETGMPEATKEPVSLYISHAGNYRCYIKPHWQTNGDNNLQLQIKGKLFFQGAFIS